MWRLLSVSIIVLASSLATEVSGQGLERGDTVSSRARPDFDPAGLRVGGLSLFPALTLERQQDSNNLRDR